jgi:hypothetical protein
MTRPATRIDRILDRKVAIVDEMRGRDRAELKVISQLQETAD